MQRGRHAQAGAVQHGRPEQAVEIDDVLADEVVQLGAAVGVEEFLEGQAGAIAQRLEAGQVADRCVEPDIEELARCAGNRKAEVRRVARDVPVAQAAFGIEPFAELGDDARMGDGLAVGQFAGQPVAQQRGEMAHAKKEVLGVAQHRFGPRHDRARFAQVGRCIGRAAVLAVVAVLVGRAAVRADAADVAVRQEHLLDRIVQLLDRTARDVARIAQSLVDRLGQFAVFRRVGGVVLVVVDREIREVALVRGLDRLDELLGAQPGFLRGQHDRRAMGVVGADEMHGMPAHALGAHPDVGLDVADQMADVQGPVGIGQGIGDKDLPCRRAHSVQVPRVQGRGIIARRTPAMGCRRRSLRQGPGRHQRVQPSASSFFAASARDFLHCLATRTGSTPRAMLPRIARTEALSSLALARRSSLPSREFRHWR